jgi:MFS family permease
MINYQQKKLRIILHFLPFYLSVFLGAFLLFQVQPVISKYILPWFGGSSSVWTTSVLFFEVMLLVGYLYAYLLTKLRLRLQIIIHIVLLILILSILVVLTFFWESAITPPVTTKLEESVPPVVQILALLFISVGLPYFLLSTTSSLLQRWFSYVKGNQLPYTLYAISNAGSLLGILAYPFVIELIFPIKIQGAVWTGGFVVYAFLLFVCALYTWQQQSLVQNTRKASEKQHAEIIAKPTYKVLLYWLFLPTITSLVLLATTNKMTQSVAPVPFLWLLPLGIYLLSFILSFSSIKMYFRNLYAALTLLSAVAAIVVTVDPQSLIVNLVCYVAFLFSAFMLLHGELYRLKPHPSYLNLYYFLIALGGAIGGFAVVVIAPLVFNTYWEYYLGIYIVSLIAISVLLVLVFSVLNILLRRKRLKAGQKTTAIVLASIALVCFIIGYNYITSDFINAKKQLRNFYGTVSVEESTNQGEDIVTLYNGDISHGSQFTSVDLRKKPTTYYGNKSGIGLALNNHPKRAAGGNLNVGIVGLGVGTLAVYGESGDHFIFYEINPVVVDLAYSDFTYLSDSKAKIDIVLGDARLSMEQQLKTNKVEKFDILVIDAFTDDAIPVHLLTKEAFGIYRSLLKPDGILAIHISNKFLRLEPVVTAMADFYNMQYGIVESDEDDYDIASATWVLLSDNRKFFEKNAVENATYVLENSAEKILWTDDYSNLFQLVEAE